MAERRNQLDALAVTSVLACALLWGFNQVVAKLTLAYVPPLIQAGLRSLGAGLLVLIWAMWLGIRLAPRSNGTGRAGLLVGLLFAAEFGCIFVGLQFTPASRMTVFIYLAPFVVALGMPFISDAERLRPAQWLGMGLAFAGVAWAFAEGFSATQRAAMPQQWLGDALGVLAALLWGATTLTIRATGLSNAPAEQTLFYQLAVSGVALTVASLLFGEPWPRWGELPLAAWGLLGFQTVIVTFASYLLWFWLIRHYPATRLASFTLVTPLAGLVAGIGLLGEPLTVRLLVACAAVAAGILLVNRPPRRPPRRPEHRPADRNTA